MSRQSLASSIWAIAALFWLSVQLVYALGLRINRTPSLPLGIWRIEPVVAPLRPGLVVSFCPPDNAVTRTAKQRGFVGRGTCAGGYRPMLKQVAALEGSRVAIGSDGVQIDGQSVAGMRQSELVHEKRALPPGGYLLQPGQFWASSLHPKSFDSRYFGPVATIAVLGRARLIFRFRNEGD